MNSPLDKRTTVSVAQSPGHSVFVPFAIVVVGLYFGRPVLLPLTLAILLAFIVSPLVVRLARLGLGRIASVLIAVSLFVAIIGAIAAFVGAQGARLAQAVPRYQANLTEKLGAVRDVASNKGFPARILNVLKGLGSQWDRAAPPPSTSGSLRSRPGMPPVPVEIREAEPAPLQLLTNVLRPLVHPLSLAGLVLVFVVFILLQKDDLQDRFIRLVGPRDIQRTKRALDDGAKRLSRYLVTQVIINTGFGLVLGLGLYLLGIPSAVLWGLLFGIMRFIPYIGVPLAAILPLTLALAVGPDWAIVAYTALLIFGVEFFVGQVIEPIFYSQSMGLSTAAVVISATFWTWLWGPVGLLLSTPLTMCLVVLGQHVERLEFLHVLLSDKPPLAPEQMLYLRLLTEDPDDEAAQAELFLKDNTIEAYCDQIALKALALAQADVNRGSLEPERCLRINGAVQALLQNLADWRAETGADGPAAKPAVANSEGSAGARVLCVAGKSILDEAAAHLLVHVLGEKGIGAQIASATDVSAAHIDRLDVSGKSVVCICSVDAQSVYNPTYLMRRMKRRIPDCAFIACFWGLDQGDTLERASPEVADCKIVTTMQQAVTQVALLLDPHEAPAPILVSG